MTTTQSVIDELNQRNEAWVRTEFTRCCGASAWVNGMLKARPFLDAPALFDEAERVWWSLQPSDWLEAFTHHPKIGDVENLRQKFAATADWSEGEQSGVNVATEDTLAALAEGNLLYEEKFGFIFIVCATGKTADEMLDLLQDRLQNDADIELKIAAGEQAKITKLRLQKLLTEGRNAG